MSQKLIPLDEATEQFGVSKEKLNELREAGKVRAYRDGSSWKFRSDDLEKALAEAERDPESSDLMLNEADEPSDPADSILVSDADADLPGRPPSTVIGKPSANPDDGGSDLELTLEGEGSDVRLAAGASDILAASTSGSHVLDDPSVTPSGSGTGKFEDLDEIEIDLETESSQILSKSEAGIEAPQSGDSGPESDLQIVDSDLSSGPVELVDDEDDEMVLGGGHSDITLSGGDSGINIVQPSDSGLELDEIPLDLSGSSISSLDLGGDVGQEEDLVLEEAAGEDGEDLETEDDFLLTPLEGDSEESSSQVIALDSEEDLAGMVEEDAAILIEEPAMVVDDQLSPADLTPADATAPMGGMAATAMVPDTSFSGANVALLALCIVVLLPAGVMAFDLLRNMWTWNETSVFGGGLVDALNFFK